MIYVTKQPQTFTPSESPVLFQVTSDITNLIYFDIEVKDADNNQTIASQRYQTLPNLTGGTVFDLGSILSPYVNYELNPADSLIEPVTKLIKPYKLSITDYQVLSGTVLSNAMLTVNNLNVWNAEIDRVNFTSFNYLEHALSSVSANTRFLTNKPAISNIYQSSIEYLYLLNSGIDAQVQLQFYGAGHTLLGSHIVSGITASTKSYRLNVSPPALKNQFGSSLANMYGGEFDSVFADTFGTQFGIQDANYFTVQILDASGNTKSEKRTYILRPDSCKGEPVQLVFSNNLGGYDGLTMLNPTETISVSKSVIKTYPYQFNGTVYSDINNGVYNETEQVYHTEKQVSYKMFSEPLNEATSLWIKGLIEAKKVFVKLANGVFLPVSITTNNYNVIRKRYTSNNNRLEIEFKVNIAGLRF